MDFRELEYFVTVCEEMNISRAADRLYVGQPTLTKCLQKLDEEWGTPLFSKKGRQMQLTYAGERLLSYAEQLLQLRRSLENEMNDILKRDIGSLRIGMPPVRCSITLPKILPAFHAAYPNVRIEIIEDASARLDRALLDGSLDIAFFNLSHPKKNLTYEIISEDHMYAIVQKGHPIGKRAFPVENDVPGIRLEWLKDETFLLQTNSQRQGEYMLKEIGRSRLRDLHIQEHTNIRAAVSLASSGYGVAFLSTGLLRYLHTAYTFDYYSLPYARQSMQFTAAWKTGCYQPAYTKYLIDQVRQLFRER